MMRTRTPLHCRITTDRTSRLPATLALITGMALAGCAVGPDFHRPAAPTTDRYTVQPLAAPEATPASAASSGTDKAGTVAQTFVVGKDPPADWWKGFGSSELDTLVDKAMRANPTVQAAEAALRQARENVAAQRGGYFPSAQLSAAASRNRNAVQVLSPTLTSGVAIFDLYTPQVTVSFVPDLLGANRRQVESLQAAADMSRFEVEAAYLTLAANVVTAAIQEAGLREQIDATGQVIAEERESLAVMRREVELGAIAEADVLAQDAALAQLEATLPSLQKSADQQRDMLAALLGELPGDAQASHIELDKLTLPTAIPVGVPAQLVERRPDVRAAEAQLHAATAAVGVSIANMLPQITLTGAIGNAATETNMLFTSLTEFWSAGASLTQTLFAGGTLYHRERAARAGLDVAGAQYRTAVLTAFQNVADALRALAADGESVRAQERYYVASSASLAIARQQFDLGAVSYLALLNAEQSYQQAVIGRAQAQTSRYADTAALFEALGGASVAAL
jgi:NodT family efflux transporter outer membrane factor (OMF) lipoprotein